MSSTDNKSKKNYSKKELKGMNEAQLRELVLKLQDDNRELEDGNALLRKKCEKVTEERDAAIASEHMKLNELAAKYELLSIYLPSRFKERYKGCKSPLEQAETLLEFVVKLVSEDAHLKEYLFKAASSLPEISDPDTGEPMSTPEGEGKDDDKSPEEKVTGQIETAEKKIRNGRDVGNAAVNAVASLIVKIENGSLKDITEIGKAVVGRPSDIVPKPDDEDENEEGKPKRKRAKNRGNLPERAPGKGTIEAIKKELIDGWNCPACGHGKCTFAEYLGRKVIESLAAAGMCNELSAGTYVFNNKDIAVVCNRCGFRDIIETGVVSVTPGSSLSLHVVISAGIFMVSGFAVNAFKKLFFSGTVLGHSTLYDAINNTSLYLLPYYNFCHQIVYGGKILIADETKYRVVNQDGAHMEYMPLGMTVPYADEPAVYCTTPDSRAEVKNVIEPFITNAEPEKFVTTDAYATYVTEFAKDKIRHQLCLGHFACRVHEPLKLVSGKGGVLWEIMEDLDGWAVKLATDPEVITTAQGRVALVVVLSAKISWIFDWEEQAWLEHKTTGADLYEVRRRIRTEHSAPIWQDICTIIERIADYTLVKRVKKDGSVEYDCADGFAGDKITKDVIRFFMNHRKLLGNFIKYPQLAVSSNDVEQLAKKVARLRNASLFSRSNESAEVPAIYLTCVHTALMNGITNVGAYLYDVALWSRNTVINLVRVAAFKKLNGKTPALNQRRQSYTRRELFDKLELPTHLQPKHWAEAHPEHCGPLKEMERVTPQQSAPPADSSPHTS